MASSDQSVATSDDPTTDDVATCPLCAETASELGGIYRHLMVNHRKSELSRLVLAFDDAYEAGDTGSDGLNPDGEPGVAANDSLI